MVLFAALPEAFRFAVTRARPPAAEGRCRPDVAAEAEVEGFFAAVLAAVRFCGASAFSLRVAVLVADVVFFVPERLFAAFLAAAFFSAAFLAAVFRRAGAPRLPDDECLGDRAINP